jgi:predicted AAA+ superfamily ATPase
MRCAGLDPVDVEVALREQPGRFLLSGSANILNSRKVQEVLTGRIELLRLWPLRKSSSKAAAEIS